MGILINKMLANYLKNVRASKVLASPQQAVQHLGANWSVSQAGALEKQFEFGDFTEASNFIGRYTNYCVAHNFTPQWSNVYNKVNVSLSNAEFGQLTDKEVKLGQYLDTVSQAHLEFS